MSEDELYIRLSISLIISIIILFIILIRYRISKKPKKSIFKDLQSNELESIANNIQNNIRIILTILGVLISFILVVQIDKLDIDIAFITWISITFAMLFRGGIYLYDVIQTKLKSHDEYRYALDHIHRFYAEALMILLLLLTFTPLLIIKDDIEILSVDMSNIKYLFAIVVLKFVILFILSFIFIILFDILLFMRKFVFFTIFVSLLFTYIISLLFAI